MKISLIRRRTYTSFGSELADFLRIFALFISLVLFIVAASLPLTIRGHMLFVGQFAFIAALLLRSIRSYLRFAGFTVGVILLLWMGSTTLHSTREYLVHIPPSAESSVLSDFLDEEDGIFVGFRLLRALGGLSRTEYHGLQDAMEREYDAMRSSRDGEPEHSRSTAQLSRERLRL